jgi:hypothetical protein
MSDGDVRRKFPLWQQEVDLEDVSEVASDFQVSFQDVPVLGLLQALHNFLKRQQSFSDFYFLRLLIVL